MNDNIKLETLLDACAIVLRSVAKRRVGEKAADLIMRADQLDAWRKQAERGPLAPDVDRDARAYLAECANIAGWA